MLKLGSTVLKFGRQGKPHQAVFKLADDESSLSWEDGQGGLRGSISSLAGKLQNKKRSVRIADMVELLVGIESNVARRNATDAEANLCLSLLVMPAPVGGAPLPSAAEAAASRESLDVRCLDEMQFGQWVAALHTLIAKSATMAMSDTMTCSPTMLPSVRLDTVHVHFVVTFTAVICRGGHRRRTGILRPRRVVHPHGRLRKHGGCHTRGEGDLTCDGLAHLQATAP